MRVLNSSYAVHALAVPWTQPRFALSDFEQLVDGIGHRSEWQRNPVPGKHCVFSDRQWTGFGEPRAL